MASDLNVPPFNRLQAIAPPGTTTDALQVSADRWEVSQDVYAAAAELWEEAAMSISIAPADPDAVRQPMMISQDGITVNYGDSNTGINGSLTRRRECLATARYWKARAKPHSVPIEKLEDGIDPYPYGLYSLPEDV